MYLTWYGSNSWLIEIANKRILLDPWLVGPLVFGNQSWFFKAEQGQSYDIPDNLDLILLSQGLPDHAHPPTLEALDKTIPVWGSPNAIKVAEKLGFQSLNPLDHGQASELEALSIEAFPGSPIGPMLTENAYVIRDRNSSESLYYEPHGFHSPDLDKASPIDVVITPLIDLTLPLLGPFIQGGKAAAQLAKQLRPSRIIPTTVGGDVTYSGILNNLLGAKGTLADLRQTFKAEGIPGEILDPLPCGQAVEIPAIVLH